MQKLTTALICISAIFLASIGIFLYKNPINRITKENRYVIFAGYNPDKTISPYIITYLKGLKEISDNIIYITDSELNEEEKQKISPYIIYGEFNRHQEYDFGSYKRGYNWLKERGLLKKAKELVFCNDSTYLIKSLNPMFTTMKQHKELDFWGVTTNKQFTTHLQSYFLVFRNSVINSPVFDKFMNKITKHPYADNYVHSYEINLTQLLKRNNFKYDSYISPDALSYLSFPNKTWYPTTLLKKTNIPFVKRKSFYDPNYCLPPETHQDIIDYIKQNYPNTYKDIIYDFPNIQNN